MACVCFSERTIKIRGKTSDMAQCVYDYGSGVDTEPMVGEGYAPRLLGSGGDYIDITFCADCGRVQGKFPLDDEIIIEAIAGM